MFCCLCEQLIGHYVKLRFRMTTVWTLFAFVFLEVYPKHEHTNLIVLIFLVGGSGGNCRPVEQGCDPSSEDGAFNLSKSRHHICLSCLGPTSCLLSSWYWWFSRCLSAFYYMIDFYLTLFDPQASKQLTMLGVNGSFVLRCPQIGFCPIIFTLGTVMMLCPI